VTLVHDERVVGIAIELVTEAVQVAITVILAIAILIDAVTVTIERPRMAKRIVVVAVPTYVNAISVVVNAGSLVTAGFLCGCRWRHRPHHDASSDLTAPAAHSVFTLLVFHVASVVIRGRRGFARTSTKTTKQNC
jgi:hypothetical protein